MPSSSSFTGTGFSLQSVVPRPGYATLRVRYTSDPLAASSAGANDGLNITNYSLTGPQAETITGAVAVSGDPQSIDLILGVPLVSGTWTLTVTNVETVTADALSTPTSLSFEVSITSSAEAVSMGAENDSSESVLRKHLGKAFTGQFWDAIIAAIAYCDQVNWTNAKQAFDQLFKISASGVYLDRAAADDGIIRPPAVGMGDELFRQYAIKVTSKKLTAQVLYEILEVFYGSDAVRAYSTTSGAEPFNLADEDDFSVLLEEKDLVRVIFHDGDFTQASQATAIEVAAAITRAFRAQGLMAFAVALEDPETGDTRVRMYSSALGLGGGVRITGGKAQNQLQFPELLTTNGTDPGVETGLDWAVSSPSAGLMRVTLAGATTVDMNQVREGDYVNIYGANFATANQGSFPIVAVDVRYVAGTLTQYFEVENPDVTAQSTVTIVAESDLLFFRPKRSSISGARTVVVSQPEPGVLHIVLPATTLAVNRTVGSGAYLHAQDGVVVSSIERIGTTATATTGDAHGLSVGGQVIIDGAYGNTTAPSVIAGNGTTTTDASPMSIFSAIGTMPGDQSPGVNEAVKLADGSVLVVGGDTGTSDTARRFEVIGSATLSNGGIQKTYSWTSADDLPVQTVGHRLSLLTDSAQSDNVLLAGGWDGSTFPYGTAYIYNTVTDSWSASIPMDTARYLHQQVVLDDGSVLIVGGLDGSGPIADCEIFTPSGSGGSFAVTGSMTVPRSGHQLVKLANGKVLVIGGEHMTGYTAGCELFDPATGLWTQAGSMAYTRNNHRAVMLPDDQILVVGGYGDPATSSGGASPALTQAEVYDGATGRWSSAGSAAIARFETQAVYLPVKNKVLVLGADTVNEYFDVVTRKWSRVPTPGDDRFGMTITVMEDDAVLITSGDLLDDPSMYIPGSDTVSAGRLNGQWRVTAVGSATEFSYETTADSYTFADGDITAIPVAAPLAGTIPGPYIFDPDSGVGITGTETTTSQDLNSGQQYRSLTVADASEFPDSEGYLSIAFGSKLQVQPVRYLGRFSATELMLDYSFRFPTTVPSGATVTLLDGKTPFIPDEPEEVGSFYATASSSGRVAAQDALDSCVAASIDVDTTIQYPGDRGLGGEGLPAESAQKLSDKVVVWGGDEIDAEVEAARNGEG